MRLSACQNQSKAKSDKHDTQTMLWCVPASDDVHGHVERASATVIVGTACKQLDNMCNYVLLMQRSWRAEKLYRQALTRASSFVVSHAPSGAVQMAAAPIRAAAAGSTALAAVYVFVAAAAVANTATSDVPDTSLHVYVDVDEACLVVSGNQS